MDDVCVSMDEVSMPSLFSQNTLALDTLFPNILSCTNAHPLASDQDDQLQCLQDSNIAQDQIPTSSAYTQSFEVQSDCVGQLFRLIRESDCH